MRALEKLYRALNDDLVKDNVFETEEVQQAFNAFNVKYIEPAYPQNCGITAQICTTALTTLFPQNEDRRL